MRTAGIVAALCMLGCDHGKSPAIDASLIHDASRDGAGFDGQLVLCRAAAGTANVQLLDAGASATFTRLDAGGVLLSGPVPPFAGVPMSLNLLFTNADPLDVSVAGCCSASDPTCCPVDGLTLNSDALAAGAELGAHMATFTRFRDHSFMLSGSVTITSFVQPFDNAPGRVAGSVSATNSTRTISGTFDNSFCEAMLQVTI